MGESTEVMEKKEEKVIYRTTPAYYREIDYNTGTISYEIHLPGVDRKNVTLKILPDMWHLEAFREEEGYKIMYTMTQYFPFDIKPESVDAKYENGLLTFTAKVKDPLEEAVDIKLSD